MLNLPNYPARRQRGSNACHPQSRRDESPSFGPENKSQNGEDSAAGHSDRLDLDAQFMLA
jgi:hypothetical protein